MTAEEKLTQMARSYIGYNEKASNKDLDDFKANSGYNNYTAFARDYKQVCGIDVQAQAWCDVFVNMMFVYSFGAEKAQKMIGGFSAYTPESANYFKKMGRYFSDPVPGDVIFFKNNVRIYHTGIVSAVSDGYVHTIEGNTSSTTGVEANGGTVAEKKYSLSYGKIAGYGRPKYDLAESEELTMTQYEELKNEISEMKNIIDKLNGKFIYNYMDSNMPDWAKPTIQKMMDKGYLKGNEKGELGLTDELLRVFVSNDRVGIYGNDEEKVV